MTAEKGVANSFANSVAKSYANSSAVKEVPSPVANRAVPAAQGASHVANTQSRLQKGASPLLSRPRPDAGDLVRRLTDRDREILRAVARHRVLTSIQLQEMFFSARKRALMRLLHLYRLGALDRFEPLRLGWGRHPYHYTLGRLGVALIAAEAGQDAERAARRWRADRTLALGRTQRLAHLLGINDFCAALVGHARRHPDARLIEWMTEAETARWADDIVRPDAFGQWGEDGRSVEFFLEYDRGTETVARLVAKLTGYERLEDQRSASAWVLFRFPSAGREAAARAALAPATVPVATAGPFGPLRPYDAVWWPLCAPSGPVGPSGRVRLAQLADVPIPPEAARRSAVRGPRAWRFDRSRNEPEEAPIDQT